MDSLLVELASHGGTLMAILLVIHVRLKGIERTMEKVEDAHSETRERLAKLEGRSRFRSHNPEETS